MLVCMAIIYLLLIFLGKGLQMYYLHIKGAVAIPVPICTVDTL
jgi:hypothetical protein